MPHIEFAPQLQRHVACPAKPERKDGEAEDPHPWTLDQVWVLEGFDSRLPETVWAGTNPGGLFRFDLVYRHGLDIDADGNLLAMGSTTGSLWVSTGDGLTRPTEPGQHPPWRDADASCA